MAGVTRVPGDKEYTTGRLIFLRTWHDMSYDKVVNNHSENIEISSVYTKTSGSDESKKAETKEYLRYIGYLT
jgi:hypothetical protein